MKVLLQKKEAEVRAIFETRSLLNIQRSLFVCNLYGRFVISHIIDFFKDVGEVVHIRLAADPGGNHVGIGFVSFASANEAKKAREKNAKYFRGNKIYIRLAKMGPSPTLTKFCIDHTVWYKDYLRRESLPIEEDETPPYFGETVLFVANLSPQTKMSHVKRFFDRIGEVVSIRLIVNQEGKHVGYGFVEFNSAFTAKKALEKKNGEYLHDHKIFVVVANSAPDPPRPKYNLAERLCYEDHVRQKSLLMEEDETAEGLDKTPDFVEAVAVRKKTLFVDGLSSQTEISHIINFFKDVGEVVHVRLNADYNGMHVGCGFVEFASVNQAKKALEKKNGEYLHDHQIFLDVAKADPFPPRPMFFIDHKVWYEDYLRRESLLMEEDKTVIELVEEVNVRKKTLFASNLGRSNMSKIIKFFEDVGEVIGVRLIVNHRGERVGCGFVEFASVNVAKKALKMDNKVCYSNRIILDVVERAPYPLQTKYNLAEKIWYENYLRREGPLIEEETKPMGVFCGKKITFSEED